MQCASCHRGFQDDDRVIAISGSIMGDEVTDVYYRCPSCNCYTVATWWDDFTGVETVRLSEPVAKEAGDRRIALIRQCSRAWDKKCRCDAHRAYFNDQLD